MTIFLFSMRKEIDYEDMKQILDNIKTDDFEFREAEEIRKELELKIIEEVW